MAVLVLIGFAVLVAVLAVWLARRDREGLWDDEFIRDAHPRPPAPGVKMRRLEVPGREPFGPA